MDERFDVARFHRGLERTKQAATDDETMSETIPRRGRPNPRFQQASTTTAYIGNPKASTAATLIARKNAQEKSVESKLKTDAKAAAKIIEKAEKVAKDKNNAVIKACAAKMAAVKAAAAKLIETAKHEANKIMQEAQAVKKSAAQKNKKGLLKQYLFHVFTYLKQ